MKVFLTGAFGNIGESTLKKLLEYNYDVVCFDILTPQNEKKALQMEKLGEFDTIWGDITEESVIDILGKKIKELECIIHLAAIIPPASEKNHALAEKVNVGGTQNIIDFAKTLDPQPKFLFASSISVHGPRPNDPPPRTADDELKPTDKYTHTKVACEKLIKESNLPWTIFRFGAIPPLELNMAGDDDLEFFDTPYEQRIEFGHTEDVGTALANAVGAETTGKILLIGGGKSCQLIWGDFINGLMIVMGIGKFPESAFIKPEKDEDWYYTDWMDTVESQSLLNYQNHTYDDYLIEMKKQIGFKRYIIKLISPFIRRKMLKSSKYS